MTRRRTAALALAATSTLMLTTLATNASATATSASEDVRLVANLRPVNGSDANGKAVATVSGTTIEQIDVSAQGLTPDGPHAVHIHYGDEAANECPTPRLDVFPRDGFLSAFEGLPAYGPIVVSLTTGGGTGAGLADVFAIGEAGALARAPIATDGTLRYSRGDIPFTDVDGTGYNADGGGTAEQIAASVREGEGVLVIHGVDYNDSGAYDISDVRGPEKDLVQPEAGIPAEAVDIASCGVLRVANGQGQGQVVHEH